MVARPSGTPIGPDTVGDHKGSPLQASSTLTDR